MAKDVEVFILFSAPPKHSSLKFTLNALFQSVFVMENDQ